MMLHVVADAASSYLFNVPLEGTLQVVSQYYMVAVVFLPLAIVELRGDQIRVDLFVMLLPKTVSRFLFVAIAALTAAFFVALAYYTGVEALHSTRIDEVMMGNSYVVIWPSKWILPAGFGVTAAATLLRMTQAALGLRRF